ncbi:unannotated protein [freshwater metagenome]|uniref:Unannotated protein n=1 Tax=freshwater metagenome TaxID=449393 RepID=A0A6J7K9X6_9ZZZZ
MVDEVLLALRARDLVDGREHGVEVAELLEELRGGLVADAGDARDVVRRVALEPVEVGDERRRQAVAVDDGLVVVDLDLGDAARGGHDADEVALVDELELVAVARDDHGAELPLARVDGERADDVIGLPALRADVGVAEGGGDLRQERPLLAQEVGLLGPLRLVLGVDLLAPGHPGVPDDGRRDGPEVLVELHQHGREAEDRVRRLPGRGGDGLRQREERPVGQRVAVDQEEVGGLGGHGRTIAREAARPVGAGRSADGPGPRARPGRPGLLRAAVRGARSAVWDGVLAY